MPSLIAQMQISYSWKSTFLRIPQYAGGIKTSIHFFGPKWDDFWSIERLWAIHSQRVYRNPRPTHISGVMRRLREEVRNTDPKTLTRLVHELPAKMNEIYRLQGKKIPVNFDPRKTQHACKCDVCVNLESYLLEINSVNF